MMFGMAAKIIRSISLAGALIESIPSCSSAAIATGIAIRT